jgi:multidrug resistance efflux pump
MRPRIGLFICAVVLALVWYARSDNAGAQGQRRARLEITECRVVFPERVPLASERQGILMEVLDEGVRVQQGQIVARLQDNVPRASLAVAEARATDVDVRVARKEQEQAQAEYDAALKANQGAGDGRVTAYPETEITRRRLAVEAAALRVEQAAQDLEVNRKLRDQALAELEASYLRSPVDGMVTLQVKRIGEGIRQAEPVVEVVNTDVVRVEGFVPLNEVQRWRVGRAVDVYADLSPADELASSVRADAPRQEAGPFPGVIGFVDVSVQPLSRSVRIWAAVSDEGSTLRDGMTARMVLVE